jgi:ADP-ribosylglycohydrolase
MELPRSSAVEEAVSLLGNGTQVTCPDTVPLCLWLAVRHLGEYQAAMWTTAACGGDIDTNCAIVGGIVAMSDAVPGEWLRARGPLYVTEWPETDK